MCVKERERERERECVCVYKRRGNKEKWSVFSLRIPGMKGPRVFEANASSSAKFNVVLIVDVCGKKFADFQSYS